MKLKKKLAEYIVELIKDNLEFYVRELIRKELNVKDKPYRVDPKFSNAWLRASILSILDEEEEYFLPIAPCTTLKQGCLTSKNDEEA